MQQYTRLLNAFDWLFALSVFVLMVLGLSALYGIGLSQAPTDFTNVTKQLVALSAGLVVALLLSLWNYRLLQSYVRTLFVFGLGVLTAVLIVGVERRGTTGWFDLGFFDLQPAGFVNIILVVVLATVLANRTRRKMGWKELLNTAVPTFLFAGLVMLQPDFGSAALMIGIWLIMILFAGLDRKIVAALAGGGVLASLGAWFFVFEEFQRNRILVFLNPELDPLGHGYNVVQAKIAIGAGRFFGRGLGLGSQSQLKFLPEAQTDFIFAAIAEELGFLGVLLVLAAFGLFFWRLWVLMKRARDDFTGYLVVGLGALIFLQMTVNIAFNLGLMPVTGLPLPFVSYGGSALLASFIVFGILEGVMLRASRS